MPNPGLPKDALPLRCRYVDQLVSGGIIGSNRIFTTTVSLCLTPITRHYACSFECSLTQLTADSSVGDHRAGLRLDITSDLIQ